MSHVYEKRIAEGLTTFPEFLAHRVARLWPLHLFAMLTMLGVDILYTSLGDGHVMNWNSLIYTFLLNLGLLQNIGLYTGINSGHTWDGNAWSLTPEIVANLIWFYLLVRKKLSSKLLLVTVLACSILQYNTGGDLGYQFLGSNIIRCIISYALGCLMYRHFIANPALVNLSVAWINRISILIAILFGLIVINSFLWHSSIFNNWEWIVILFIFPSFSFCILQPNTIFNALFSSRIMVFLGTISYAVYLMQVQIALLILEADKYLLHYQLVSPYLGMIYVALVILVATLCYQFIENPLRRILRQRLEVLFRKVCFDPY